MCHPVVLTSNKKPLSMITGSSGRRQMAQVAGAAQAAGGRAAGGQGAAGAGQGPEGRHRPQHRRETVDRRVVGG